MGEKKVNIYGKRIREQVMGIIDFIKVLVVGFAVTAVVLTFIRLSVVDGYSMYGTLKDNQKLIVLRTAYDFGEEPQRGDIIVADGDKLGVEHIIKRIIGLPGETVEMKDNKFYINGELLDEHYIREEMENNEDNTWVLGEDEYFLCGDNRNYSSDSRIAGPITYDEIFGKVVFDVDHFKTID